MSLTISSKLRREMQRSQRCCFEVVGLQEEDYDLHDIPKESG